MRKYIEGHESCHSHDAFRSDPKVKLIMEIFNALSNSPIEEKTLIKELLKTGHFSEDEAKSYIKPAVIHGMFKEDIDGLYVRT